MEGEVLEILRATTVSDTNTIRNAEISLRQLYSNPDFPFTLLFIANHHNVEVGLRKAALTTLRNYVLATWSPQLDEHFQGQVFLTDQAKAQIREQVLALCTSNVNKSSDNNVSALAASVVSRIASVDFPEAWPDLFDTLIKTINSEAEDAPIHGALRVLNELVDSSFSEEQFFGIAADLVNSLEKVATSNARGFFVRAMAMNVFRSCFDTLQMVMEYHRASVKGFVDGSLGRWKPFFVETIKTPLPPTPSREEESAHSHILMTWKGMLALKIQVIKTLDKIRTIFAATLSPHILDLFQVVWDELFRNFPAYREYFVDGGREGKLVDADGLPYTLDALVLEELDFLQVAFKAPPVKTQLNAQIKQASAGGPEAAWLQELFKLLVSYAQIQYEEVELWNFDTNLYFCEMSSIAANYTPRAACADVLVRGLSDWLKQLPAEALLYFWEHNLTMGQVSWKELEAALFLLQQILRDLHESSKELAAPTINGLLQQIPQRLQDPNTYMRASAHLVLGALFSVASAEFHSAALASLTTTVQAATSDESDVVKLSCVHVIRDYMKFLSPHLLQPLQQPIIGAIREYVESHGLRDDLEEAEDIKSALVETLRDAILINSVAVIDGPAIDLFFTLASDGASDFMIFQVSTEAFEGIVENVTEQSHDAYVRLCAKTLPAVTGAFDVAKLTEEDALTFLAAELVSSLVEFGSEPLPPGFVAAVMPKLSRVLMEGTSADLVRPATKAVQHILSKGTDQFLAWHDHQGRSAVIVTLTIVNRLLNSPDVEEAAATEVGGLASALVMKAGADQLGLHLMDLLAAVANRLATATRAAFIQSLLMVFAGLCLTAAKEVVDFLSQLPIQNANGLQVVLTKWLENSINFAGFDEIRQNTVALSRIYSLDDPRIKAIGVKGDLIIEAEVGGGRIKTRSQAKLNPDRYTTISAQLKILKILVEELSSSVGPSRLNDSGAAAAGVSAVLDSEEEEDGDDEWEDEAEIGSTVLDLASGLTKQQLMALGDDGENGSVKGGDEETAAYLTDWFRAEAQKPEFQQMFGELTPDERQKLMNVGG